MEKIYRVMVDSELISSWFIDGHKLNVRIEGGVPEGYKLFRIRPFYSGISIGNERTYELLFAKPDHEGDVDVEDIRPMYKYFSECE